MAHRLVCLEVLRHLGQRERPTLLAGRVALGVAQIQELTLPHVAEDRLSNGRCVLRQHHGRSHDLQNAGVLELSHGVAGDTVGADGVPACADRIKDDELFEPQRRYL